MECSKLISCGRYIRTTSDGEALSFYEVSHDLYVYNTETMNRMYMYSTLGFWISPEKMCERGQRGERTVSQNSGITLCLLTATCVGTIQVQTAT